MHPVIRFLVVSFIASAGFGQSCFAQPAGEIRIRKLLIESNSLPDADRDRIIHLFQQKTYLQGEISPRIQIALRSLGYLKAVVDEPKVSLPTLEQSRRIADITVKVNPGVQYRLGEIHIRNATVFPSTRLRESFSLRKGDLFSATVIGKGLEDVRKLYATRGYVNLVATPEVLIDESRRTIDLVVHVDEGKPFDFGRLYLEGAEPHVGAGKALLKSWETLEGRRYNPTELQHWLLANHSDWNVSARVSDSMRIAPDPEALVVNVKLTQWPD